MQIMQLCLGFYQSRWIHIIGLNCAPGFQKHTVWRLLTWNSTSAIIMIIMFECSSTMPHADSQKSQKMGSYKLQLIRRIRCLNNKKKKIMSSGTLQGQNLIFIACFNFSLTWAVSLSPRVHCHLLQLFVCLLPHSYAQLYCSPQIEFKFSIGLKLMAIIIDKYTHCVQKKGNHRQTKWNYHALNYYNQ